MGLRQMTYAQTLAGRTGQQKRNLKRILWRQENRKECCGYHRLQRTASDEGRIRTGFRSGGVDPARRAGTRINKNSGNADIAAYAVHGGLRDYCPESCGIHCRGARTRA